MSNFGRQLEAVRILRAIKRDSEFSDPKIEHDNGLWCVTATQKESPIGRCYFYSFEEYTHSRQGVGVVVPFRRPNKQPDNPTSGR